MLLLAVIIGGSAYYLSRQQTPVYRASQKVLIQPSRTDLGLTEASRQLLSSNAALLDNWDVAKDIIEQLRLDQIPAELMNDVTIAPDILRMVVQIDVDSPDSALAERIAQAWGQWLADWRNEQNQLNRREDRVEVILLGPPTTSQRSPRPRLTGVAGAILGLLVGAVIAFVMEYLESSIVRRSEDLERALEMPVLAAIPHSD